MFGDPKVLQGRGHLRLLQAGAPTDDSTLRHPQHFTVDHDAIADLVIKRLIETGTPFTPDNEGLVRAAVSETLLVLHL